MKTDERLLNEKVNDWNVTFHSILKNYVPILVFAFTKDFPTAIVFRFLLSRISLKDLIKEIKGKDSK
jgi:hypothetical protein